MVDAVLPLMLNDAVLVNAPQLARPINQFVHADAKVCIVDRRDIQRDIPAEAENTGG